MSKHFSIPQKQMAPIAQTLTPKTVSARTAIKAIALNVVIETATEMAQEPETETETGSVVIAAETVTGTGTEGTT